MEQATSRGRRSFADKLAALENHLSNHDTVTVNGIRLKSDAVKRSLTNIKHEAILVKSGVSSNDRIPIEHQVLLEILITDF